VSRLAGGAGQAIASARVKAFVEFLVEQSRKNSDLQGDSTCY
jgi:hypothetical protein